MLKLKKKSVAKRLIKTRFHLRNTGPCSDLELWYQGTKGSTCPQDSTVETVLSLGGSEQFHTISFVIAIKFNEILPVGFALFHVDRRTDAKRLTVAVSKCFPT